MGLNTKQVSGEGILDWNQTLLQAQNLELPKPPMKRPLMSMNQSEPLNCPRCDSSNTKFCYYNNYNKTQPRYFCKACKRHWTKGGTLRNVPVGGGRKNKRHKTTTATATATTAATGNTRQMIGDQNPKQSSILFDDENLILGSSRNFIDTKGLGSSEFFGSSTFSLPQNQSLLPFSFSSSSSSSSFQSSNINVYGDPILMPSSSSTIITPVDFLANSWQMPNTSSGLETTNYWNTNWDDLENLVSSSTDHININPWEDPDGAK